VRSGLDQPALLENADQIGRSASSITFIKIIGVGMIVAVILDATLAQLLLVPAGMLPMPSGRSRREPTRAELVDLAARQEIINRLSTRADSAFGVPRMLDMAVPRSVPNYVQARWTTSENADWCMNMRTGDALNSAESDAPVWSPGLACARWRAGPREVDARYLRGTSQAGRGSLAWPADRCLAGLAGNAVRLPLAVCGHRGAGGWAGLRRAARVPRAAGRKAGLRAW
jgi:hypothetical protein